MKIQKTSKLNSNRQQLTNLFLVFAVLIAINVLGDVFFFRLDLTKEKRYTLTPATKELLKNVDDEIFLNVFLDGPLPIEYKKLKNSVRDLLHEFRIASNGAIQFQFEDILTGKNIQEKRDILSQLYKEEIQIEQVEVAPDQVAEEKYVIPAAKAFYKSQEYPLNFLKRDFGKPLEQEINESIELLEYEIANLIRKCVAGKKVKLLFVEGHGELNYLETADITKELQGFYEVERMNLNIEDTACTNLFSRKIQADPENAASILVNGLIRQLQNYEGIIIAKPTKPFREVEKFILDQYIMNGGKVIWLVESLIAEMDSVAKYGKIYTANHDHNLGDMLFHYGVKIKPTLVQDIQCNGIPAINQATNRPGFFPWVFYPLFNPAGNHPIIRNLESIWGQYCSTLDTTSRTTLKKTVLLKSSENSRIAHNPVLISLDMLKYKPDPKNFVNPHQMSAVLIEGSFKSPFEHRNAIKRGIDFKFQPNIEQNAMIVIGDGDIIRNQISADKSQIYPLGYDKYASSHFKRPITFANKKFFLNCVDFLCDKSNIIDIRSKEVVLRLLNKEKIKSEKRKWVAINTTIPIIMIVIFGLFNEWYRRRRWV